MALIGGPVRRCRTRCSTRRTGSSASARAPAARAPARSAAGAGRPSRSSRSMSCSAAGHPRHGRPAQLHLGAVALRLALDGADAEELSPTFSPSPSTSARSQYVRRGAIGAGLSAPRCSPASRSCRSARRFRFGAPSTASSQIPRVLPGIMVGLGVFYALVFAPGLFELPRNSCGCSSSPISSATCRSATASSPRLCCRSRRFRPGRALGRRRLDHHHARTSSLPIIRPALLSCLILLVILSTRNMPRRSSLCSRAAR